MKHKRMSENNHFLAKDEDKADQPNPNVPKLTQEERKAKIRTGAKEMAELYRSDPELKELNEFVGDYRDHDSV